MGNITHNKVSEIEDGDDESLVRPSDWNAEHSVSRPVDDDDVADKQYVDEATEVLDYGLSFLGIITAVADTTHFTVASLIGLGTGFFKPFAGSPYEIFVVQADGAAPEGEQTPVVAFTSGTGIFQHTAFTVTLAVGDKVLLQHPVIAALGTKASAAATGAVSTTKDKMAYIKQLVTELRVTDAIIDAILVDVANAVPEPPTAKSIQDILHKDTNYAYSKTTDSLEALSDEISQQHLEANILFVIPEAVASINADNQVLLAELQKIGAVYTITQANALMFPAFSMYALCVCGTNSGTAWTTSNLADLKVVIGLPIVTVDKIAGAYFEIGTDGGDATTKTVIRAISEIKGTLMGIGQSHHFTVVGLAAGNNIVSSSATYHTLDMSNANITEHVYCTETVDPDGGTANTDVVMGEIPHILPDGTIGTDENGADVPAPLIFLGFCYDASALTTLGKATFYLFCHMTVQVRVASAIETPTAVVVDLRNRLFGNMKGDFTPAVPLVEWIAGQDSVGTKLPVGESLYDILLDVIADTEDLQGNVDAMHDTDLPAVKTVVDANESKIDNLDGDLVTAKAVIDTIKTILDTPANFMANIASLALEATLDTHDTDIKSLLAIIAGYIDTEIAAITPAGPSKSEMDAAHALLTTPAQVATALINYDAPTEEEMDIGHGLLATPAQVATALNNYDAIKRSEATTDRNTLIAMAVVFGG